MVRHIGHTRFYVSYKKHTLRLWLRRYEPAVLLIPLVSWATPGHVPEGYRCSGGDIVGIACAREKEHRGGVWWSGLPYGKFQRAALLCEPNAGELFAVCLPRSFLEANGSRLSKTRAGQTHFTVVKRGSKVLLAGVDVTSCVNNYSLIA